MPRQMRRMVGTRHAGELEGPADVESLDNAAMDEAQEVEVPTSNPEEQAADGGGKCGGDSGKGDEPECAPKKLGNLEQQGETIHWADKDKQGHVQEQAAPLEKASHEISQELHTSAEIADGDKLKVAEQPQNPQKRSNTKRSNVARAGAAGPVWLRRAATRKSRPRASGTT